MEKKQNFDYELWKREAYGTVEEKKVHCKVVNGETEIDYHINLDNGIDVKVSFNGLTVTSVGLNVPCLERFNECNTFEFSVSDCSGLKDYKLELLGQLNFEDVINI